MSIAPVSEATSSGLADVRKIDRLGGRAMPGKDFWHWRWQNRQVVFPGKAIFLRLGAAPATSLRCSMVVE
ncbi:hypothetical protein AM571_PC01357 (plasmid) [Rhizobium etli 8C-3]|uniref:Uncharacterized protein n=1 Tax=Rhizobium etli 8C-3 TaxID=538025 RepID=A0A1L5PFQ6_RHIET|nr:hypothetical protein AM571_PC01357 [Rhizobium etli 8C-3]